jgi:hypothetical protein
LNFDFFGWLQRDVRPRNHHSKNYRYLRQASRLSAMGRQIQALPSNPAWLSLRWNESTLPVTRTLAEELRHKRSKLCEHGCKSSPDNLDTEISLPQVAKQAKAVPRPK